MHEKGYKPSRQRTKPMKKAEGKPMVTINSPTRGTMKPKAGKY